MHIKSIIAVWATWACVFSQEKVKYTGYSVQRLVPDNEEQQQMLLDLQEDHPEVIFMKPVGNVKSSNEIAIPPHLLQADMIQNLMGKIPCSTITPDLESMIDQGAMEASASTQDVRSTPFDHYMTEPEMTAFVDKTVAEHPTLMTKKKYGTSFEGRDTNVVICNDNTYKTYKKTILIDCGFHAREWITPATCLYLIHQLATNNTAPYRYFRKYFECHVAYLANPDGYVYSYTVDRLWRKTRSVRNNSSCVGTDPNRNWDYNHGAKGASSNPCDDTYHGEKAFSCPETASLADYSKTLKYKFCAISMHSYSQLILLSYGNTTYSNFARDLIYAKLAAKALQDVNQTPYQCGNSAEILYITSGTSSDWLLSYGGWPYAYTYELRDTGKHGFMLPADQIIPTGEETIASIMALCNSMLKHHNYHHYYHHYYHHLAGK